MSKNITKSHNSAQKFTRTISSTRKEQIGAIQTLNDFLSNSTGRLTLDDRKIIVEQALTLLERSYVHLPLKKAMHAVDPIQRLRLLQLRLDETSSNQMDPELEFHKEMIDIFTSVRDLHTNYMLPIPFSSYFAFLPFQIESYIKNNQLHFLVTKIAKGYENHLPSTFQPGVDLIYWNGVPMQRAVEINANKNAGSNLAARFARGLQRMARRPMMTSLPPDEEWVVIGYRTQDGLDLEYRQDWLVSSTPLDFSSTDSSAISENSYNSGLDLTTDLISKMDKILFAPENVIEDERRLAKATSVRDLIEKAEGLRSVMPQFYLAKKISEDIGYIRIFSFNLPREMATIDFINEFLRLMMQLPRKGLVIDVRGNGGGRIPAAESLLQLLTHRKVTPEPYQFISSPLTLEMTRRTTWLNSWTSSLSESVATGSSFSRGFPITTSDEANNLGQQYHGPVILITDALCYSATDLFAAGFQDHQIGRILGIDGNTGAGGANVWEHSILKDILAGSKYELKALPSSLNMRVSIRRNVRVGEYAGTPIEDLGITPDIRHNMTSRDLLEENVDLIKKASEILADMPVRQLDAVLSEQAGSLEVELTTIGISRVDMYVDGRPVLSQNVTDGTTKLRIDTPNTNAQLLEIVGLKTNEVVATRKVIL
jgi:C-terminal processing protease CtpA/Prc